MLKILAGLDLEMCWDVGGALPRGPKIYVRIYVFC